MSQPREILRHISAKHIPVSGHYPANPRAFRRRAVVFKQQRVFSIDRSGRWVINQIEANIEICVSSSV